MKFNPHNKKFPKLLPIVVLVLVLGLVSVAQAQSSDSRLDRPVSDHVAGLKLDQPLTTSNALAGLKLDASLVDASGSVEVLVRLEAAAMTTLAAEGVMSRAATSELAAQQGALVAQAQALDANVEVLAQTTKALNAVMLQIDATALPELAASGDVVSVNRVHNYELDLSETVPYIGASSVQASGFDGTGVSVAVLDSGIDYLHANLGGSGDPDEYAANDPNIIEAGTFPTAKVVGGYDFTGSDWPNGDVAFDPDPLDDGVQAGHGTHVADIIGGLGGVAPNADLYAVKVCSSVSTSCSGIALIAAMDYVVDPNGDGDFSDRIDIVNMSLGSNYGTAFDDDLSRAVENAAAVGVLTVSSAGNGSDKPYITGTPSASPSALAVAQTAVPSAVQPTMEVLTSSAAGTYFPVFQGWSAAPTVALEFPVQYADGAGNNLDGCAPFDVDMSGKIVLIDRGGCNFTLKIFNVQEAGAEAGIIGLVAPGDPFNGGDGGDGPITIPGYMISQADSVAIQSAIAAGEEVIAQIDPAQGLSLVGTMIGSSSRGPAMGSNLLKPEIGAPGASVSAVAGSGTGEGPFGGTSGASPMVAGSAALLMQAYPDRSWAEIRAVLVNSAETEIYNGSPDLGASLAPISRIGGGEVRVDRALDAPVAIWDADSLGSVLSFGFEDVVRTTVIEKRVHIQNYSGDTMVYKLNPSFRYEENMNGAVKVELYRKFISVPPYGSREFTVRLRIQPYLLPDWVMNAGSNGANGDALTAVEFGGYLELDNVFSSADNADPLHIPWHVLPRAAASVRVSENPVSIDDTYEGLPAGRTRFGNRGWGDANLESYSLIAVSDDLPEGGFGEQSPTPDFRYIGYTTIPVAAGFCSGDDSFLLSFAVNSWERQTNPIGVSYWINIDVDQDATTGAGPFGSEYTILNRDFSLNNVSDGRNLAWVIDWSTGAAGAFFFTDHDTNSGNTVLTICGEQIGMNAANFFQPMDITAQATDFYYGGPGDVVEGMTISPLGEQYLGIFQNSEATSTALARGEWEMLNVVDFGAFTNNTETGLLVLARQGAEVEAFAIEVE